MINKEDIKNVNKIFGERPYNESNLDFEVSSANDTKNGFRKLAHITRAMTAGHAFSNANKRTALVVLQCEMHNMGLKVNRKKLVKTLVGLTKTKETSLNIIERRLRKTCNTQ